LDFKSPVIDKRIKKLSYVAEGFLLIYAKLRLKFSIELCIA
jgi:hypothetical protein